jgi:hypothetical protein
MTMQLLREVIDNEVDLFSEVSHDLGLEIPSCNQLKLECYDYRLGDNQYRSYCMPMRYYHVPTNETLGRATLIFIDNSICQKALFYQLAGSDLILKQFNELFSTPCLIIGYSEFTSCDFGVKLLITKSYLKTIAKIIEDTKSNLLIEINGQAKVDIKPKLTAVSKKFLGAINPASRPVLSAVKFFGLKRVEGIFEPNTLGPIFYKSY